jgi:hypothetical protein
LGLWASLFLCKLSLHPRHRADTDAVLGCDLVQVLTTFLQRPPDQRIHAGLTRAKKAGKKPGRVRIDPSIDANQRG